MNEFFERQGHLQTFAPNASVIWQREEFLRVDCARLLRRELGFYLGGEHNLRAFRLSRALDELRQIQAEIEAMLRDETTRN